MPLLLLSLASSAASGFERVIRWGALLFCLETDASGTAAEIEKSPESSREAWLGFALSNPSHSFRTVSMTGASAKICPGFAAHRRRAALFTVDPK